MRPRRRHRLSVKVEADDLDALVGALSYLADEISVERPERRDIDYRGFAVTYRAKLRTDPDQDGDRYREQMAIWRHGRRRRESP